MYWIVYQLSCLYLYLFVCQVLSNGSLSISEVYMEDTGKYGCTAGNSGGFEQAEVYLQVIGQYVFIAVAYFALSPTISYFPFLPLLSVPTFLVLILCFIYSALRPAVCFHFVCIPLRCPSSNFPPLLPSCGPLSSIISVFLLLLLLLTPNCFLVLIHILLLILLLFFSLLEL